MNLDAVVVVEMAHRSTLGEYSRHLYAEAAAFYQAVGLLGYQGLPDEFLRLAHLLHATGGECQRGDDDCQCLFGFHACCRYLNVGFKDTHIYLTDKGLVQKKCSRAAFF